MIEVAKRNRHKDDEELRAYLKGAYWEAKDIEKIIKYINKHLR